MAEFVTGLFLGGFLVFFTLEYHRVKSRFIPYKSDTGESVQWQNMMNYNGSERGQITGED